MPAAIVAVDQVRFLPICSRRSKVSRSPSGRRLAQRRVFADERVHMRSSSSAPRPSLQFLGRSGPATAS